MTLPIDWDEVAALRQAIAELEAELELLYRRRLAIVLDMNDAGYSRRVIAAHWDVSNPRITVLINRHLNRYQDPPV